MRVLITGATGFIGRFLTHHCLNAGCSLMGIDLDVEAALPGAIFERCDIRDLARLAELLSSFRPDRIFHLVAQSYPGLPFESEHELADINVRGTVNLFESIRTMGIEAVAVVACSSGDAAGATVKDRQSYKDRASGPLHPYGMRNEGQDLLTTQYFANLAIPAVRIRVFNPTGPGMLGDLCSDLAKLAIEIELGRYPARLPVGDLKKRRPILDVRDSVRGLWLAAERCQPGEVYNIAPVRSYWVEEIIDAIRAGVKVAFTIEEGPEVVPECDAALTCGDITTFRNCTSWTPQIELGQTLHDMLDWWRTRLASRSTV